MNFIEQLKYRNELLFYFGLTNLLVAIVFLVLAYSTSNVLNGVNAWFKPFKFALSTNLYCWAMLWYCYYLPNFNTTAFNWVIIITLGFEVAYIALRASRAELSHYNVSTPLSSTLFSIMALAATVATLYTAYISALFFATSFPTLPVYYIWSIRFALILFVIFAFEGFAMGARLSHSVGGNDDSFGLPIVNWSKKFGDLRIAHFIGMHALQILPILSFYLLKNTKAVLLVAAFYSLLAIFTLIQAIQGRPLYKFNQERNESAH
jgi:hypothetical protein